MNFNNKIIKINIRKNLKNNLKESETSLLRVNDKNSIKEYYNLY